MPRRQRKAITRRSNTRRSYKSGGSVRGNLGTNGAQLSNNASKITKAQGGKIRKMQHGGMHNGMSNGCPPGTHMMPNGQCMAGEYHGQLSGQNSQPTNQTTTTSGGGSSYQRGGSVRRKNIPSRRTGGPIRRRKR